MPPPESAPVTGASTADALSLSQEAQNLARSGNVPLALDAYARARQAGYEARDLPLTIAALFRTQGHAKEAILVLVGLQGRAARDPAVLRELARAYVAVEDFAQAARAYDGALEQANLSNIKRQDIDDLIDLYQGSAEAERENGNQLRATILYANLADYLQGQGFREQAASVRAIADKNARESVMRRATRMAERQAREQATSENEAVSQREHMVALLMARARQELAAGLLFAATEDCHDVIHWASDYLPVHLVLAEIYMRRGHTELAANKIAYLSTLYDLRGDYREAAEACRVLAEVQPANLAVRRQRIAFLLKGGLTADAVEESWLLLHFSKPTASPSEYRAMLADIEHLASITPELLEARGAFEGSHGDHANVLPLYLQAAEAYRARGSLAAAVRVLQLAVQAAPAVPSVREQFADCLLDDGKLEEGIRELMEATDLYRKQGRRAEAITPLLRVAQTYEAIDDMANTVSTYDLLLRLAPDNASIRQHFINFSLARGRREVAVRTLRALTEFFLGRHNVSQAIASLTQLISLQPDERWGYAALADLLVEQGAREQAIKVYERFVHHHPEDTAMRDRLQAVSRAAS